jgi:hypothetical protein
MTATELIVMRLDRSVALARGTDQTVQIGDLDIASTVAYETGLLERVGDNCHAGPLHPEHLR